MCEFCKKFDFGTATAKVDKYGASNGLRKTETAVIFRKHMAWLWTLCGVEVVD